MLIMPHEPVSDLEEKYISFLHRVGINLGVFVLASASFLAFALSFIKLIAAVLHISGLQSVIPATLLETLGVKDSPLMLMLVDIVDTSLLAAILLTLAFGIKSVFLGKRYRLIAFDIQDINELKEYVTGLVITLMGTRFLELILTAPGSADLLFAGLGVASVILALAVYSFILKRQKSI